VGNLTQPWLVKVRRRNQRSFPPITRGEFAKYLQKARVTRYVRQPELASRDASLLAFEFLFVCRVSEAVGRVYPRDPQERASANYVDDYQGVTIKDFKVHTVRGNKVLQVKLRILKRGRKRKLCPNCEKSVSGNFCKACGATLKDARIDYRIPEVYEYSSVSVDHPFAKYILNWLNFLLTNGATDNTRVFAITPVRAWQIMKNLGIMNHTQRHWRATQLSDTMDAFDLKDAMHRATLPLEYVHRSETRKLARTKKADKIWA